MLPDQPYKYALPFLNAHIHILDDRCIKHACRHMSPPTCLQQGMQTLEDDAFPMGETVSDVGEIVT
jgi:hypothetical protein